MLLFLIIFILTLSIKPTNSYAHFGEGIAVASEDELLEAINDGANAIVINSDIYLEQALVINHPVRLSGTGAIKVTGHFRHFRIRKEGALTLEGELSLQMADENKRAGGEASYRGGGISISGGSFYMHGGEIVDIYPPYRDEGRPIYGTRVVVVENGGTFHMYDGLISGGHIGSVWVEDGSFKMVDGEISHTQGNGVGIEEGNVFHMYGGRIVYNSNAGVAIDKDSTFYMYEGEISYNGEMGVLVNESRGVFNFYDGVISNNQDSGVEIRRGIFNMYGGVIKDNVAYSTDALGRSSGGGVDIRDSAVFVMNGGKIIGNTAANGGGVYINKSRFYMVDGTIASNTAGFGGGVSIQGGLRLQLYYISNFYIHISGGEISENEAKGRGGGIGVLWGVLKVDGGTIRGNRADGGGGIYMDHSYGVIRGGVIQENVAEGKGGGIFFDGLIYSFAFNGYSLALTGGRITDNSATTGGGIYTDRLHQLATGSEVIFSGNIAQSSSRLSMRTGRERYPHLMWAGENSLYDSHLLNNFDINYQRRWEPTFWQMYLFFTGIAVIIMILRMVLYRRKKEVSTGAICIVLLLVLWIFPGGLRVIAAEEVEVVTNEQELLEAISQSENKIIVNDVIHIEETIMIERPVIIGGTGAIVVADNIRHFRVNESGELTLKDNLTITLAEGYSGTGGGILVWYGTLHMYGGEIKGNNSTGWRANFGGGVHMTGGEFRFHGGRIHGNAAAFGGGIGLEGQATLVIYDGEIYNNHASVNGGGISDLIGLLRGRSLVRMYGGSIRGNVADVAGGGIHQENSFLQLLGGEIDSNIASGHGGISDPSFGNRVTIGADMRIVNNYPPSFHDTRERLTFMWFVRPDGFRYVGVLVIAIIATWLTNKSHKKKTAKPANA